MRLAGGQIAAAERRRRKSDRDVAPKLLVELEASSDGSRPSSRERLVKSITGLNPSWRNRCIPLRSATIAVRCHSLRWRSALDSEPSEG
jgi:hypothetical protein